MTGRHKHGCGIAKTKNRAQRSEILHANKPSFLRNFNKIFSFHKKWIQYRKSHQLKIQVRVAKFRYQIQVHLSFSFHFGSCGKKKEEEKFRGKWQNISQKSTTYNRGFPWSIIVFGSNQLTDPFALCHSHSNIQQIHQSDRAMHLQHHNLIMWGLLSALKRKQFYKISIRNDNRFNHTRPGPHDTVLHARKACDIFIAASFIR